MKLVLVGRGPDWERAASEKDADALWCTSSTYLMLRSVGVVPDKVFQIHGKEIWEKWLPTVEDRTVLIAPDDSLPWASVIPVDTLVAKYGRKFHSTFAWMLGMGLEQGFDEIALHGIHLGTETEYGLQRDSFFWFYGWANAHGVKITIQPDCWLAIRDFLYGVDHG